MIKRMRLRRCRPGPADHPYLFQALICRKKGPAMMTLRNSGTKLICKMTRPTEVVFSQKTNSRENCAKK